MPDAMKAGAPAKAEEQATKLMALLREHGWDWRKVPYKELRPLTHLPDQKYAENPIFRDPRVSCMEFPRYTAQRDIAFMTDIYVRMNRRYYRGDTSEASPTGKLLVGWKSGKIEWVDPSVVREITSDGNRVMALPGMPGYSPSLPPWPEYIRTARK